MKQKMIMRYSALIAGKTWDGTFEGSGAVAVAVAVAVAAAALSFFCSVFDGAGALLSIFGLEYLVDVSAVSWTRPLITVLVTILTLPLPDTILALLVELVIDLELDSWTDELDSSSAVVRDG